MMSLFSSEFAIFLANSRYSVLIAMFPLVTVAFLSDSVQFSYQICLSLSRIQLRLCFGVVLCSSLSLICLFTGSCLFFFRANVKLHSIACRCHGSSPNNTCKASVDMVLHTGRTVNIIVLWHLSIVLPIYAFSNSLNHTSAPYNTVQAKSPLRQLRTVTSEGPHH